MTRAAAAEREGPDEPHLAVPERGLTPELLTADDVGHWKVLHRAGAVPQWPNGPSWSEAERRADRHHAASVG